ncbi:MAG TPA: hypothetical protein VHZ52_11855 [Acidobacteriaceae bacterium]|jgi:hypothetical protein|nr:hypothetical protein [Acidobacteriaceae bacterium]
MATSIPNGDLISLTRGSRALVRPATVLVTPRRRKLSREAGHAIEMLGHSIEYLADELALDCMDRVLGIGGGLHPRLRAIEILKRCNREIYLSCPEVPTIGERVRGWLRLKQNPVN